MNFDLCCKQRKWFWSELVSIKSHGSINIPSPHRLHTIHSFNFLRWIKARQTHQAIGKSIWTELYPSADLSQWIMPSSVWIWGQLSGKVSSLPYQCLIRLTVYPHFLGIQITLTVGFSGQEKHSNLSPPLGENSKSRMSLTCISF